MNEIFFYSRSRSKGWRQLQKTAYKKCEVQYSYWYTVPALYTKRSIQPTMVAMNIRETTRR